MNNILAVLFHAPFEYSSAARLVRLVSPFTIRQPVQPITFDPNNLPLLHDLPAHKIRQIKIDRWFIPLQHAPVQPLTSQFQALVGQLSQERLSISLTSKLRPNKQVLQVDPRGRGPRRVVVEVQRHAGDDGLAGVRCGFGGRRDNQESLGVAGGPSCLRRGRGKGKSGAERVGCCDDLVEGLLVVCQLSDQLQDDGDI
jgi:hypothetical protein